MDTVTPHSSPDRTDPNSQSPSSWETLLMLSEEQVRQSYQIQSTLRWLLLPVAFLLTLCNVVVFLQPSLRGSAACYVVSLSLAQLLNLLLYLVLFLLKAFLPDAENSRGFWIYSLYGVAFCSAIAQRGSFVVLCLFSLERLYAVVKPLHLKTFLLSRRPGLMIGVVYVLSAVLHVYVPTKTYVGPVAVLRGVGGVVYKPLPTPLYLRQRDLNDAFSLLAKAALVYLPLLILLVLIALTVVALRRHHHVTTSKLTSTRDDVRRRQERQMTVTIFTATVAYVALSLPQAFHHLLSTAVGEYSFLGKFRNLYLVNNELVTLLTVLSCTVDFFSFFSTSSSYRTTLCRLLAAAVCHPRGRAVVDPTATATTSITTSAKDGTV